MLASTIQFTNTPPNPRHQRRPPAQPSGWRCGLQAWTRNRRAPPAPHGADGCPLRTQQCARGPRDRDPAVYDVSTHELRHRAFAGETALAPAAPLQGRVGEMLLRKEVIQPHLPVRLPCYDFVPIASPTFDHSLPRGLGHGLRVLPTFVT
jgi:hypothetical protein